MRFFKVFLLCLSIAFLSGCIASSKSVVKLSKATELNSKNHDDLVRALDNSNILPKEVIGPLKNNSKKAVEYSSGLTKENPSIFSWKNFQGVLEGLVTIVDIAGGYFGIPTGTVEKGIYALTLISGLIGHKVVMRRRDRESKIKVKVAEQMDPTHSKTYRDIVAKVIEEENPKKVKA